MPIRSVNQRFRYPTVREERTSDRGEPWVIPTTNEVIVYEPVELPFREQGVDKVETATDGRVSTGIGKERRKST